ncbi:Kif3c, partial [Symbiodinium microadriaticum]
MAAVHPDPNHYEECLSTLQFANRCRNVTNNPRVNYVGGGDIEDKDRKIRRLMEEIVQLRAKLAQFERSGIKGGAMFTGIALAEKIQKVLEKVGIQALIGSDGTLEMGDGKKISLDELNELALEGIDDAHQVAATLETAKAPSRSVEKLTAALTELEEDNNDLKAKYKNKKKQAEVIAKELDELTNEFNRSKQ